MSKRSGCLISIASIWLTGAALLFLFGCASASPSVPPEPITVIKEIDRIVQVRCEDKRQAAPDYPDTPDKLQAIPEGDIFALAQARVAGTILRESRERENEAQIKACTGG